MDLPTPSHSIIEITSFTAHLFFLIYAGLTCARKIIIVIDVVDITLLTNHHFFSVVGENTAVLLHVLKQLHHYSRALATDT